MFGHLQVYSAYSFQDSTISIPLLVKRAKEQGIQALALTDHHQMYGAMEFKHACQKEGIKAIYGLELTVTFMDSTFPIILLAKDTDGYFALVKLTSMIQLSEQDSLDFKELLAYREHLFFILTGDQSILYRLLLKEMQKEAVHMLQALKKALGSHLYIGIIDFGLALSKKMNEQLMGLASMGHVPVVWTNEVRYLFKEEALTLEYLRASQKQKVLPDQVELSHQEAYLKNELEISQLFSENVMKNTAHLLLSCQADIPTNQRHLPRFQAPKGAKSDDYLKALCQVGLKKRFQGQSVPKEYIQRLKEELKIIIEMKFSDYFLIVYDYVRFAKINGILVGPGRGSAAGSLVSYVLGITNVDPIKYQLIFERFLNPERISMPDIDVDFQDDRREEVVNYVIERYGKEHVCQIVTFNTYGPRVAIKDLGKAAGVSLVKLEQLAKMVPTMPKFKKSARQMYQESNAFQSAVRREMAVSRIMPSVFIVENLPRNISTHAAGVILSGDVLSDVVPLALGPSHTVVSQYSKDYIEEVGLLKMDFLGLKNLTILSYILKGIEENEHIHIDLQKLPFDDQKTYDMIAAGDTFGVFQLESDGMISLLRKIKVSEFEDIIAAIALFRPGPMENIPSYLRRKHHQEPVTYIHEDLKDILEPTYGIMIYQEQIMQIATRMAGFTMGRADILRKAVSKKESALMQSLKEEFIQGAIHKGYSQEVANEVYENIERFANYGFNRSHSVAYALVAYQMAYLKAHYPLEFFAALLSNNQSSDRNKLMCMQESRKYGVSILKPSINYSCDRFVVEGNNIRYSLLAIKDVGIASYQAIVQEREKNGYFKDYLSFMRRMSPYRLSSKTIEALIDAGALDDFEMARKMMKVNLEMVKSASEQTMSTAIQFDLVLKYEEDQRYELLENEKKVLGIYLTTHPVVLFRKRVKASTIQVGHMIEYINQNVMAVLCIERVKTIRDKKGANMSFLTCYDETGSIDCVLFSDQYERYKMYLKKGNMVLVRGKVTFRNALSLNINELKAL